MLVELGTGPHCTGCAALDVKWAAAIRRGDEHAKAVVRFLASVHGEIGCMRALHRYERARQLLGLP